MHQYEYIIYSIDSNYQEQFGYINIDTPILGAKIIFKTKIPNSPDDLSHSSITVSKDRESALIMWRHWRILVRKPKK